MVDNKCSKCGKQAEYTISINTDKGAPAGATYNLSKVEIRKREQWCLHCFYAKLPSVGYLGI